MAVTSHSTIVTSIEPTSNNVVVASTALTGSLSVEYPGADRKFPSAVAVPVVLIVPVILAGH